MYISFGIKVIIRQLLICDKSDNNEEENEIR